MKLQWFRVSLNMAHVGAGRSISRTVFIQAPDALGAWEEAQRFPGAKKGRRGSAGNDVTPADVPKGTAKRDKWYWRGNLTS